MALACDHPKALLSDHDPLRGSGALAVAQRQRDNAGIVDRIQILNQDSVGSVNENAATAAGELRQLRYSEG